MKFKNESIIIVVLAVVIGFTGCKKYTANEFQTQEGISLKNVMSETINWIDLHEPRDYNQSKTIDLLKKSLDFEKVAFEKRNNGDDILIIPVEKNIKEALKIQGDYSLALVLVKKVNKFRWSMIVAFKAEDGKPAILDEKSIRSIVNNELVDKDGTYKFYNIMGKFLYQTTYKDKKLRSYGSVRKKENVKSQTKLQNSGPEHAIMNDITCTDWYLVTIYYDENNMVIMETRDYLFTTCEGDGEGGGDGSDGGGEGGGGGLEEPIDVEMTQVFELRTWFADFDEDDYQIPSTNSSGPPMAEIPIDPPTPTHLQYICRLKVTYFTVSRQITGATALPVSVSPVNSTYNNMTWGMINRNVTVFYATQNVTYMGSTVSGTWSGILSFKWTYSGFGTTRTKQVGFSQAGSLTLP